MKENKIITPVALQDHIDKLIKFAESKKPSARLKKSIQLIKDNYIETAALVRVQSFANAHVGKKFGKAVSRQFIYEQIDKGKIVCVEIDEVKFIKSPVTLPEEFI